MADPARRKRADGERRRERIIQAAADLIAQRGFAGTAVDEIGEAAGITGSGVYRHFGTKDAVWQAVLERSLTQRVERVAAIVEEPVTPHETLARLVDDMVEAVLDNRGLAGALWQSLRHLGGEGNGVLDRWHRLLLEEFVHVLTQLEPTLSDAEARLRVDAVYGLVLSAAEYDSGVERERLRANLNGMGIAALTC